MLTTSSEYQYDYYEDVSGAQTVLVAALTSAGDSCLVAGAVIVDAVGEGWSCCPP